MRRLVITLLLLYCTQCLYCQNIEADSLKQALATSPESPERVLILEGLSYAYVSAFPDTALQYAMEGLQLAQKIDDARGEAYCTNALGNVYFGVGDYPKALEMYLESLKMKEAIKDKEHAIGVTYFNIANVYTEQEDYKHALSYLFKSKVIDEKVKDSGGILFDLYSLSSIYLRMTLADSALYYVKQAYDLAARLKDENMIGAILNNYGEVYAYKKYMPAAAGYYHQSIVYVKAINDNEVLSSNYFGLAKAYKALGRQDSAIYYARQALGVAQEAPFLKQLLEASMFLAEAYKSAKQYDSAFTYQELGIATKDSLYNVEKIKKVQNLKLLEQQRQQVIEVAKLKYQSRIKLYAAIAALAVFLVIAIMLWRNNKQKQKAYQLLQQQKAITEEALKDLQATQVQLLQKEKMASLGELTAGIAHEIQNPLNFINNFSDINAELLNELQEIRTTEPRDPKLEDDIHTDIKNNFEKIIYHGKRADSIVKNMLLHSRTTEEAKRPVDINALVDEYFKLSFHAIRAKDKSFNAVMETNFDPAVGKIEVVQQDLGRVLLNLFNNAFYAVSAAVKNKTGEEYLPKIIVATKKLSDQVHIIIRDNGTGIPPEVIAKIFQPFFTTKPTGEGTGLGLSLSYDIITKAHGGNLKVDTKEGEFTEFTIELPA